MNYKIITDSASNLSNELIEKHGLDIIPLAFIVDGKEELGYKKGETINLADFYDSMRQGKHASTSMPNEGIATKLFEDILKSGKDIIYIGFSSALSGTFELMNSILLSLIEKYPERKFKAIDSLCASGGQGLLVHEACIKMNDGIEFEELAQWIEDSKLCINHWFTVEDLKYLHRGGRVSKAAAIAGTILNVKPVLHVDNEGRLIPMSKAKGRRQSLKQLVKHFSDDCFDINAKQDVFINHADSLIDAMFVQKEIQELCPNANITLGFIDPVIGAHSGPGTIALFFRAAGR